MRVEFNEDGSLDEFVAHDAYVHVEAMSDNSWWIGVELPTGELWHINLGAVNPKAKSFANAELIV